MTTEGALPPRVRQLLTSTIDTFEKLQLVRLTSQQPDQAWTFLRLADELHVDDAEVKAAVRALIDAGLLIADGVTAARYAPDTPELDAAVDALMTCYRDDIHQVVRALTERALDKIRDSVASTFADAFVIRRPKPREPSDG